MSIPAPRPGLVICYSYLWATNTGKASKRPEEPAMRHYRRPAIIEGREVVTVVPVTHTPPTDPDDAVEIPAALKAHLGLDDLPSWIVVTETNDFLWPGPDLWPLPGTKPNRYDYGMLPPRFFTHIRDKILQSHLRRRLNRVQRSE